MSERDPSIQEFIVVDPPTSKAVGELATYAWSSDPPLLELSVLHVAAAEDDLPQLTETVSFLIKQMRRGAEGDIFIGGSDTGPIERRTSFQVRADSDPAQPAHLTIVRPF